MFLDFDEIIHLPKSFSHTSPVLSYGHKHLYPSGTGMHVAPFPHTELPKQLSRVNSQLKPRKPGKHWHEYEPVTG